MATLLTVPGFTVSFAFKPVLLLPQLTASHRTPFMEQHPSQMALQDCGGSSRRGVGAVPGCCLHLPATKPDPIPLSSHGAAEGLESPSGDTSIG